MWELQFVEAQFPSGLSGTSTAVEYAYLLCQECIRVKKVEVT